MGCVEQRIARPKEVYDCSCPRSPWDSRLNLGYIETAMMSSDIPIQGTSREGVLRSRIPRNWHGIPNDVADTAPELASDLADFVMGESILVDGAIRTPFRPKLFEEAVLFCDCVKLEFVRPFDDA